MSRSKGLLLISRENENGSEEDSPHERNEGHSCTDRTRRTNSKKKQRERERENRDSRLVCCSVRKTKNKMRDREREIIGAKQGTASYSDKRERECVNDFFFFVFFSFAG